MSTNANTLTLYSAVGILTDLLDATDKATLCDNCGDALGDTTWNICTGPAAPEGTRGLPEHHHGHTACTKCAMDPLSYVAEGGACRPCLMALGGRRSSVIKAGVALRPPVKNCLADRMLSCHAEAKRNVDEAHEAQDAERRQEGADRRAAAVEDVRRRRAEAEADAERVRAAAEEEAEQVRAQAEQVRAQAEADAAAAKERMEAEAAAFAARMERDAADLPVPPAPPARKRKVQPPEVVARRAAAAAAARADKKRKLEEHAHLTAQNNLLEAQLLQVMEVAKEWMRKSISAEDADAAVEGMVEHMHESMDALAEQEEEQEQEEEEQEQEQEEEGLAID